MDKKPEQKELQPPTWIKVKDIEKGSSGYNVKVKLSKVEKDVNVITLHNGKKLTVVKAVVGDETGVADALFKLEVHDFIAEGAVIAIRNGRRQIVKGHIVLETDMFGRLTAEKDAIGALNAENNISAKEIKRREAGSGERRRNNPRRNREDDEEYRRDERERKPRREHDDRERKPRREYDDRRGEGERGERRERRDEGERGERRERGGDRERRDDRERREDRGGDRRPPREDDRRRGGDDDRRRGGDDDRKPLKFIKIEDIEPGAEGISFVAKILTVDERHENREGKERTFLDCVLGDSTGIVNASFFNDDIIKKSATLAFKNVNARVIRQHIQIQRGRFGRIGTTEAFIRQIKETNNISKKAYEELAQ